MQEDLFVGEIIQYMFSLLCVAVWIASTDFVRAVDVRYARKIFFISATYFSAGFLPGTLHSQ